METDKASEAALKSTAKAYDIKFSASVVGGEPAQNWSLQKHWERRSLHLRTLVRMVRDSSRSSKSLCHYLPRSGRRHVQRSTIPDLSEHDIPGSFLTTRQHGMDDGHVALPRFLLSSRWRVRRIAALGKEGLSAHETHTWDYMGTLFVGRGSGSVLALAKATACRRVKVSWVWLALDHLGPRDSPR